MLLKNGERVMASLRQNTPAVCIEVGDSVTSRSNVPGMLCHFLVFVVLLN